MGLTRLCSITRDTSSCARKRCRSVPGPSYMTISRASIAPKTHFFVGALCVSRPVSALTVPALRGGGQNAHRGSDRFGGAGRCFVGRLQQAERAYRRSECCAKGDKTGGGGEGLLTGSIFLASLLVTFVGGQASLVFDVHTRYGSLAPPTLRERKAACRAPVRTCRSRR
jgi:hypothetical protein